MVPKSRSDRGHSMTLFGARDIFTFPARLWSIWQRVGFKTILQRLRRQYASEGIGGVLALVASVVRKEASTKWNYSRWIDQYDTVTEEYRSAAAIRISCWEKQPLISVIMPTYNPRLDWLRD